MTSLPARTSVRVWALALLVLAVLTVAPAIAVAQRVHVVRSGQSLARIAARYDVRVSDLAAANGLGTGAALRPGMELRVPEANVAYVQRGQTLSDIARHAGCSVDDLVRLNRLRSATGLRVGQRIVLPGYEAPRGGRGPHADQPRWGRPRAAGVVSLYRVSTRQRTRFRLVDRRGRATRAAVRRMTDLMRPRDASRRERFASPPPRLLEILARISDHFGGRTVHVVSGFRHAGGYTRESSQHTQGHALDIHVDGVPNTELRDFARTFERVGVGYYPRSTFVHVDVRDRSTYWVDWSRPGEAPRYQRRGEPPPDDVEGADRDTEGGDDVSDAEAEPPPDAEGTDVPDESPPPAAE
ncbi:MAG: LysM peptidoglycan-binding domain-containing protein [Sandaracinaceae bacterium]|nr:LysM peptidoglycan-binding domain-containing protein [Sandaracinaceae bacterium]